MTLLRLVALLVLINVAALLWPSGDKEVVLGPVPVSVSDVDADAISLLAETDEYVNSSTGLVLATMRPDGKEGEATSGPYYMLNEWDESVTQLIDEPGGEASFTRNRLEKESDSTSREASPRDADKDALAVTNNDVRKFRPLLLGLRPDLSGGYRSEQWIANVAAEKPLVEDSQSPDGPPLVAINAQRLRNMLTRLSPALPAVDRPVTAQVKDDTEQNSSVITLSSVSGQRQDKASTDQANTRTAQPDVVGVDSNTVSARTATGNTTPVPEPPQATSAKPVEQERQAVKTAPEPKAKTAVAPAAKPKPVPDNPPATKADVDVAAVAPVGPTECVRLGPFFSKDAYQKVSSRLTSDGMAFRGRSVDARKVKAIRVFLGPFANPAAIESMSEKLRSAGIRDFYVMPASDSGTTVSLGLFSTQQTANSLIDRLASYDIGVQSREELRQLSPTFWLETQKQGITIAQRDALKKISLGDRHARLRKMSCKSRG